jgi:uncharacterized protein (UPF0212 family)
MSKLKACKTCGHQIAKSARKCPQCGQAFTSVVSLVFVALVALCVGWLMFGKACSQASDADQRIDEALERIRPSN